MEKTHTPTEKPAGRRCGDCKFFGVMGNVMVCRYNPPSIFATYVALGVNPESGAVSGGWQQSSFFPNTRENEWCGKFERSTDA